MNSLPVLMKSILSLGLLLSAACSQERASTSEGKVQGGVPHTTFDALPRTTVAISVGCTGTIIGYKWILTAAHCRMDLNNAYVAFYNGKDIRSDGSYRKVLNRYVPDGVSESKWYDSNGNFADIALLELDSPIDFTKGNLITTLDDNTPGYSRVGWNAYIDGAGMHDNNSANNKQELRWKNTQVSLHYGDQTLYLPGFETDSGDSGSPLYSTQTVNILGQNIYPVLGVLHGVAYAPGEQRLRSKYTYIGSVHSSWIHSTMLQHP